MPTHWPLNHPSDLYGIASETINIPLIVHCFVCVLLLGTMPALYQNSVGNWMAFIAACPAFKHFNEKCDGASVHCITAYKVTKQIGKLKNKQKKNDELWLETEKEQLSFVLKSVLRICCPNLLQTITYYTVNLLLFLGHTLK